MLLEQDVGEDFEQPPLIDFSQSSTSSGQCSIDSKIDSLAVLFPTAEQSDVVDALMINDSTDRAADHLSEIYSTDQENPINNISNASNVNLTVSDILKNLKKKMKPYCTSEKLKVDRDFNITRMPTLILMFQ